MNQENELNINFGVDTLVILGRIDCPKVTHCRVLISKILDKISEKIVGDDLNVQMLIIAITLIVLGIILYEVDRRSRSTTDYEHITFKQSLWIACSQALAAAFPGVSRSGITMTVARKLGIDRESAAKYSFMLGGPITAAAVIFGRLECFLK